MKYEPTKQAHDWKNVARYLEGGIVFAVAIFAVVVVTDLVIEQVSGTFARVAEAIQQTEK